MTVKICTVENGSLCYWSLKHLFLSHGALLFADLKVLPSLHVWSHLVSYSLGRKAVCASTSCRMSRSPWTFSNTDRQLRKITVSYYVLFYLVFSTVKIFVSTPFQVKLVNIRNDDIADGNPKLTLGLIWTIILHFQVMQDTHKSFCCKLLYGSKANLEAIGSHYDNASGQSHVNKATFTQ